MFYYSRIQYSMRRSRGQMCACLPFVFNNGYAAPHHSCPYMFRCAHFGYKGVEEYSRDIQAFVGKVAQRRKAAPAGGAAAPKPAGPDTPGSQRFAAAGFSPGGGAAAGPAKPELLVYNASNPFASQDDSNPFASSTPPPAGKRR